MLAFRIHGAGRPGPLASGARLLRGTAGPGLASATWGVGSGGLGFKVWETRTGCRPIFEDACLY